MLSETVHRCARKEWGACECKDLCRLHKKTFHVVIAGSRTFWDYDLLKKKMDNLLKQTFLEIVVVSGCALGADKLGERYATEKGYHVLQFPADWDKHGKKAGHIRNEQMARVADAVAVFWDGESPGSKNMIDTAKKLGKPVRVIRF